MNRTLLFALGLLTSTFASACSFDIDLGGAIPCGTKSVFLDAVPDDAPLAVGSAIFAVTEQLDASGNLLETLTIESSNPAILEVTVDDEGNTVVFARAAGTADVIARRASGVEHGRHMFTVVAHDRVELVSISALIAGSTEAEARVAVPRVLVDGSADFAVRLFAGDTQLYASGVILSPDVATPGAVTVARSSTQPIRASITPIASGTSDVALAWEGGIFGSAGFSPPAPVLVTADGVTNADVASISVVVAEGGLEDGACATAIPVARDSNLTRLDGVVFDFEGRGARDLDASGEVLNYEVASAQALVVTVSAGSVETTATIHTNLERSAGGSASGCSVGGLVGATQWLPLITTLGVMAARSRSRRTRIVRKS